MTPRASLAPIRAYRRFWLTAGCAMALAVFLGLQPSGAQSPSSPAPGYVGADTCLTCHGDKADSLKGTPHGQAKDPRTPAATQGCESCHGPGQAHVDDDAKGHIRTFKTAATASKGATADWNQTCLACHNRGNHAGWEGSAHERRDLSCNSCHSVHSPKSPERQLVKATETELCATCHRVQVVKTERAVAHMPIRQSVLNMSPQITLNRTSRTSG